MSKTFSNLLKHINKLSHTDKERVFQWVKRYVEPSSTVSDRLIDEMREMRFKDGFECPHCTSCKRTSFTTKTVDKPFQRCGY